MITTLMAAIKTAKEKRAQLPGMVAALANEVASKDELEALRAKVEGSEATIGVGLLPGEMTVMTKTPEVEEKATWMRQRIPDYSVT